MSETAETINTVDTTEIAAYEHAGKSMMMAQVDTNPIEVTAVDFYEKMRGSTVAESQDEIATTYKATGAAVDNQVVVVRTSDDKELLAHASALTVKE